MNERLLEPRLPPRVAARAVTRREQPLDRPHDDERLGRVGLDRHRSSLARAPLMCGPRADDTSPVRVTSRVRIRPVVALALTTACLASALLALAEGAGAAPAAPARSWAQAEIRIVTQRGLFATDAADFRPQDALTAEALGTVLAQLGLPARTVTDPTAVVSIESLDELLVDALGLGDSAGQLTAVATAAGLAPPERFGTEAVARLLGLRPNLPADQDSLEPLPDAAATRADAAYSIARILGFAAPSPGTAASAQPKAGGDGRQPAAATGPVDLAASPQLAAARATAGSFALPSLTAWQSRILAAAVSYIGYPYVWAGTGGGTGFDCSGFVWEVYKLTAYPGEGDLADTLSGRTTMEMSGEVPRRDRIGAAKLEPGDVLFFGKGPRSKPREIDHAGIYLGDGWFIHASDGGVSLSSLDWSRSTFAWARRPLAEAALE